MATKRLPADQRHEFLLGLARDVIREHGADALTLISLARHAGVTKPITYRHFGTREGLLVELYRQFEDEQTESMNADLVSASESVSETVAIVAASYVDCALSAGAELGWLTPALQTSPKLSTFWKECRARHLSRLGEILTPFTRVTLDLPTLLAMTGAADALSEAATSNAISREEAISTLAATISRLLENHADTQPAESSSRN